MKIRTCFVSNSSSASFAVTDVSGGYDTLKPNGFGKPGLYIIGLNGETEFGWGPDKIYDIDSRINWTTIQAQHASGRRIIRSRQQIELPFVDKELAEMGQATNPLLLLEHILCRQQSITHVTCILTNEWKTQIPKDKKFAYIDHQSIGCHCVDSEQSMIDFIFGNRSYIVLDNDNH